jgi:hypothetical protein
MTFFFIVIWKLNLLMFRKERLFNRAEITVSKLGLSDMRTWIIMVTWIKSQDNTYIELGSDLVDNGVI